MIEDENSVIYKVETIGVTDNSQMQGQTNGTYEDVSDNQDANSSQRNYFSEQKMDNFSKSNKAGKRDRHHIGKMMTC